MATNQIWLEIRDKSRFFSNSSIHLWHKRTYALSMASSNTFFSPPNVSNFRFFQEKIPLIVCNPFFSSSGENSPLKKNLCEIGGSLYFPVLKKSFHVCIGEIQIFVVAPHGIPKKIINYNFSLSTHRWIFIGLLSIFSLLPILR